MSATTAGLLEVGHIRRPHGLRGDVFVQLSTDRAERVAPGSVLHLADERELTVTASRHAANGRRIVHFEGIESRTDAEAYTNEPLYAHPLDDPDTLWVHELVGRRVIDQTGIDRGECVAVVANPAADLLELADGHLVPANFVVDTTPGEIHVDTPDGLFDLT